MGLLTATDLPDRFAHVRELEDFLARPSEALVEDMFATPGDIMIVGASGRMGPSLARLARNASPGRRIVAAAKFADPHLIGRMAEWGVRAIPCDLLDDAAVGALPLAENVIFMAGRRIGAASEAPAAWAASTLLPAGVARRFRDARIVAFSTGDVYPNVRVARQGADERTLPAPVGEQAQSGLGRERIFEYFSARHGTSGRLLRLHNAVDTRHGVLFEIASRVAEGLPVDLAAGYLNVIWQGDANAFALRSLRHVTSPTTPLNVSGPEVLQIRWIAQEFGRRLGRSPLFTGEEGEMAQLMNTSTASGLFGYPVVPIAKMLDWTADWVARAMPHFGRWGEFASRG